ncbi:serine protease inhibitor 42Dd-like [Teleopsis dalmanni]|uniref:serine protease inhibitor 42Dd-like n=1 Tax=Teleopsis dalmanni TaxID=139649 RepID=UPI0018CE715F|nr:serine protease inhibitor 42Dd-like [Teleopsis dalmanni]
MGSVQFQSGLFIFFIIGLFSTLTISLPLHHDNRTAFAMEIFSTAVLERTNRNVIISPTSLETCLGLAYFGANGKTAEEMHEGLKLTTNDKKIISQHYRNLIQSRLQSPSNGPALKIVNRIYANETLEIKSEFNEIALNYFQAAVERVRFADSANTVVRINNWIEQETENKIKNLLRSDEVNQNTTAILVNAIYFKGKWANPFTRFTTQKKNFSINTEEIVLVDMMYNGDRFKYAELMDLDAKALELPYNNSDVSMLFLLPHRIDGLAELERKLAGIDFGEIAAQMKWESVDLSLPRFRIEFSIDLKDTLKRLGMVSMFNKDADFSNLYKSNTSSKISQVKQKVFLDVNEAGSEAAAATFVKFYYKSFNPDHKIFQVNHPFVFIIRSPETIYFFGHVVQI